MTNQLGHCDKESPNSPSAFRGNPINLAIANKYQEEVDLHKDKIRHLQFVRSYNSADPTTRVLGPGWRHTYDEQIIPSSDGGYATLVRGDGRRIDFRKSTYGNYFTPMDAVGSLFQSANGWQYQVGSRVESFDTNGRLLSLTSENGIKVLLTYNGSGHLIRVNGATGAFLSFSYNSDGTQLLSVSDATRTWSYQYDGSGHLSGVINPDGTSRQYLFEDVNNPNALTGLIEERGIRYATWGYDSNGYAILSTHANNVDRVDIAYPSDTTRTVTDSKGVVSTYTTMAQNGTILVTNISGPGCASCGMGDTSYTYDPAYNTVLTKTSDGVTTQYAKYDANRNPSVVTEAVGTTQQRQTTYTYDGRFLSKILNKTEQSVCSAFTKYTYNTYDAYGNLTSHSVSGRTATCTSSIPTTTMQYNGPLHQLSQIDGPRTDVSDITTFTYYPDDPAQDKNRARLQRITLANGIIARDNIQYSATGKVLSETRPNALTLSYTYFPGNDRLQTVSQTDGTTTRTTRWTYLPTGEVETITLGDGTPEATTLTFGYDDARRLIRITDGAGNHIDYTLDTEGNHTAENVYDASGALQRTLSQTYDAYNRLASTAQANETHNYTFAPNGTLSSDLDGNLSTSNYSYDALKRLLTSTQDVGGTNTSTANALTKYAYNSHDDLTSVTDPNNGITTYTYDDFGNVLSQTSPDTGTTIMTYDPANNMLTRTDAKGQTFTYTYDVLNRVTSMTAPNAADSITYTYDTCTNGVGRLCSVTQNGQTTSYSYDAFGDVTQTQGVSYSYDSLGRIAGVTYPSGDSVSYRYDASGRVNGVTAVINGATQPLASNMTYAPFGPITALSYGNGATLTQTVDTAYRLTSQSVPGIYQRDYTQYDPNGNLTAFSDTLANTGNNVGYDALNRVTAAAGGFGTQTLGYDKNGNRLSWVNNGTPTTYSYGANSNRLSVAGANSVVLDANGNTTSNGVHNFTFNTLNQLVGVDGTVSYGYNALGQRIAKTTTTDTYGYVYSTAGQLLAEYDNGTLSAEYVYLNGAPLAVIQQGNVYYIHTDQLGAPRAVSDAAQKVVWSWNSDPFGSTAANDDPDGDGVHFTLNLRFPGQYYDQESGLNYNYFRYYDPSTGRYITSDPIGLNGGLNTYSYVGGNPTDSVDVYGLAAVVEGPGGIPLFLPVPTNGNPQYNDSYTLDAIKRAFSIQRSEEGEQKQSCPKDRRESCYAAFMECTMDTNGDDSKIKRCETAFELCVRNPNDTVKFPNGTKVRPSGTHVKPDGTVIRPDGTEIGPDGSIR